MTLQVYQNPVGDCQQLGGVQLPQADIAKATQPGLFDDLPESPFTVDHTPHASTPALLIRMLLCLALPVSNAAKIVAVAIAYHGWSSWPSRETLCRLTDLKSPNVSRATKELEEAGIIARRRRYHSGGNVGIQYTFNGLALAKATVEQEHPTLQGAIINVITAESDGSAEGTPAQIQKAGRDYHIDNGAIITLIPEPEMTEPEEVTLIDDFNQSTSGSSGSNALDDKRFPATTTLPAWYQQLETQLDAAIVPNFETIQEAAMLAGWTDQVMASASRLYARNYRNQRVSNPAALFRKLASQEASKVAVPAKLSRPSYSDDRRKRR